MDKPNLLKKIDAAWTDLLDSFAVLSEAQMIAPGVTGDWSVKDILAHVTTWELEALKFLPVILEGARPPRYSATYGGIDGFNAQMHAKNRDLPLAEVLDRLEKTHRRLVSYLKKAPDEAIATETRFRRRLRFDSYRHYAEHAEMITEWRKWKSRTTS